MNGDVSTSMDLRFAVPPLPPLHVSRPRLLALLDQAEAAALTLVCAGPGAGKSVLLGDWARCRVTPVAWLALTAEDDDPATFWRLFLEGAQAAGQVLPPVAWTSGHTVELLDSVYGRSSPQPRLTVVLDDAHVLTDPRILDGLDRMVGRWSHRVQLVMAARSDPLLPLHRYRLAGQCCEIRAADLAMTTAETRALLHEHGVELAEDDLRVLVDRTEGWSAGLRLAALRMQGTARPAEFVAEFALDQGSIGEYLTQEVLARQPDDVARLLIETSFLDEVTGPMADAITGLPDCGAALAALARTNSFVIPVDVTQTAFRYHQLFREVLRHLANSQSPERVRLRYTRAAQWHRDHGDVPGALWWTVRSGDLAAARQLLVHGGLAELFVARHRMTATGRAELRRLADDAPSADASEPELREREALRWAVAAVTAESTAAEARLRTAQPVGAAPEVRVTVVLARLMLAQVAGDAGALDDAAETLLSSDDLADAVADVRGLRASVLLAQARSRFVAGRLTEVEPLLRRALAVAEQDDVPATHLEILSVLAFVCTSAARLRHARAALDQATELIAEHPGLPRPVVLDLAIARRAELEADWPTMGTAVDRALAAGPVHADIGIAGTVAFVQAGYLIACGELAQAWSLLAYSPALNHPAGGPIVVFRDCRLAEIEILLGRPRAALRILRDYTRPPFSLVAGVMVARAHLALGDLPQAQACISRILNTPSVFVDRRLTIDALVCGAQIADRAGDEARAVDLLDRALRVADDEITLPFVQAGDALAALLARHPATGARWPGRPPSPTAGRAAVVRAGHETLPDPLTSREEAVLRLMTTTMSTAEIAAELGVSVHTVKSHLASIYRKLSVSRRRQAVFRARELELL